MVTTSEKLEQALQECASGCANNLYFQLGDTKEEVYIRGASLHREDLIELCECLENLRDGIYTSERITELAAATLSKFYAKLGIEK